jgi:hypothetical protein
MDVAPLEPPDDAVDQLPLAVLVLVEDDLAFRFAHALDDHLLRGLGRDAAEPLAMGLQRQQLAVLPVLLLGLLGILWPVEHLEKQLVTDLGLEPVLGSRIDRDLPARYLHLFDDVDDLKQIDAARLLVVFRLELEMGAEGLLRRRDDRLLERLDQHFAVDALVLTHLVDDHIQVRLHGLFSATASRLGRGRQASDGLRPLSTASLLGLHLVVQPCFPDPVDPQGVKLAIHVDEDRLAFHPGERADKPAPAGDRRVHFHAHSMPGKSLEIADPPQGAPHTGRGELEAIGHVDGVLHIEHRSQMSTGPRAIPVRDGTSLGRAALLGR